MIWQCKFCAASFTSRIQLFRHYRLQHSHYSRIGPLPCLYTDCIVHFRHLMHWVLICQDIIQHNLAVVQSRVRGLCYLNALYAHFSNPFLKQAFSVISESIWKIMKQWHAHIRIVGIAQMCTLHSIPIKVEHTKQVLQQTFKVILSVRIPIISKPVFLK